MENLSSNAYSVEQIRLMENLAMEQVPISTYGLMQLAGSAAWEILKNKWLHVRNIIVMCGSGNNGGDGYELAHLAHAHGLKTGVFYVGEIAKLQEPALSAFKKCQEAGIHIRPFNGESLVQTDLIVDALLGIGLENAVRQPYSDAIEAINQSLKSVLAIDVPSGLSANTGQALGTAVKATATITFIGLKAGLLTGEAANYSGEIFFSDLDINPALLASVVPVARIKNYKDCLSFLKPRARSSNKGNFGHVLVVGGDYGYAGAPRMSAEACGRTGAGLVSVATRPEHLCIISSSRPEIMAHGVSQCTDLDALLARANVGIVGVGMGQSPWGQQLFDYMFESNLPLVVDADGLNLLANQPKKRDHWILTPHPGEAARLLDTKVSDVQANRIEAVKALEQKYNAIIVLKGAGTIISHKHDIFICTEGNPGMSSGGMGDILAGIIGALCAQHLTLIDAAVMAVGIHARAADLASVEGERGMLALDLMPYIRRLVNP